MPHESVVVRTMHTCFSSVLAVHRHEEDAVVILKDVLGAIAMMDIPVQDDHLLGSSGLQSSNSPVADTCI